MAPTVTVFLCPTIEIDRVHVVAQLRVVMARIGRDPDEQQLVGRARPCVQERKDPLLQKRTIESLERHRLIAPDRDALAYRIAESVEDFPHT